MTGVCIVCLKPCEDSERRPAPRTSIYRHDGECEAVFRLTRYDVIRRFIQREDRQAVRIKDIHVRKDDE